MEKEFKLHAQIEPFDTFWEAPKDIEKGYASFHKFYKRNYLRYLPKNKEVRILVVSCGPGYFVNFIQEEGYTDILGIDSNPEKVRCAKERGLKCECQNVWNFLGKNENVYNLIFAEQEINHLTKNEITLFLRLCRGNLSENGLLIVHSLNGANPITGSEALAQNFDHYNTFTEYSLKQIFRYTGFRDIKVIPLHLYIFYENPLNCLGALMDKLCNLFFRMFFVFYGKSNKLFSKKIAAIGYK
ncbi:MAG: hypothetical protein COX20_11360 [Desulfobacterales bacterium CG23_combo_of_CG06-09_8_20_14_all_52_9]|nr:MAG: hypothetical protein COX20_11360 [Desulfobacterales bacterium CG23_combo_of_CG06-09_8_20_14_all_52_9]